MSLSVEGRKEVVRVLLVEDDPAHAELIIRSLENHPIGNQIRHLLDGEEALDYLARLGDESRPDVILLDLRLPKIDGLEVLRRIRSVKKLDGIPVVVLSTSRDEADAKEAYARYANSYIVKPLDFASFAKLMEDLGFYWLRWNHYPGRALG